MIQVIHILRQAAPYSFNLEDADGCNAVEYAIANDADMKVIKVMQRTARDDWKMMKATGHVKTHNEMERVIRLSADETRLKNVSLSEVLASSVSRQNLGLARSMHSESDNSCFTRGYLKSAGVCIAPSSLRTLSESMGSAPSSPRTPRHRASDAPPP